MALLPVHKTRLENHTALLLPLAHPPAPVRRGEDGLDRLVEDVLQSLLREG